MQPCSQGRRVDTMRLLSQGQRDDATLALLPKDGRPTVRNLSAPLNIWRCNEMPILAQRRRDTTLPLL